MNELQRILWNTLHQMWANMDRKHGGTMKAPQIPEPEDLMDGLMLTRATVEMNVQQADGTALKHHVELWVGTTRIDDPHSGFWAEEYADRTGAVVVGNQHYRLGGSPPGTRKPFRGHEGRQFAFRDLVTGRITQCDDVWYRGIIPPVWRDRLPPTHERVESDEDKQQAMFSEKLRATFPEEAN